MTKLDAFLFGYTLIFSVALTFGALFRGFSVTNLTVIALFLPVPTYTGLQLVKRYYIWKTSQQLHPLSLAKPQTKTVTRFSVKAFLTQSNPLFIMSLVLAGILILTTWVKYAFTPAANPPHQTMENLP
jgi:hypothetical protein